MLPPLLYLGEFQIVTSYTAVPSLLRLHCPLILMPQLVCRLFYISSSLSLALPRFTPPVRLCFGWLPLTMTLVCVESPGLFKCESVNFCWKLCLLLIELQLSRVKSWLTFCSASQFTQPSVFLLNSAPFDGIRHILRWNVWASHSPKCLMQH